MAVLFNAQVYQFEFNVVELTPEGWALQQIRDKGYVDKYHGQAEPVHLVGVEFSKASRNVEGFEVQTLDLDKNPHQAAWILRNKLFK